jgi:DnaJ family protein A protein 2
MVVETKLYDILNIKENASNADVKKAYKMLALKWHPDKNQNNVEESTIMFKKISDAYDVLSDTNKRQIYDKHGMRGLDENNMEHGINPDQIFKHFFGGGGGNPMFNNSTNNENSPDDIVIQHELSLEQIFTGTTIELEYHSHIKCKHCNGYGSQDKTKTMCDSCSGLGKKRVTRQYGPMIQQSIVHCEKCIGKGVIIRENNICKECNGDGLIDTIRKINVPIRHGISQGQKIKIEHKGNHGKFTDFKSSVIIVILEKPHAVYKRQGDHLTIDIEISLSQALFGFSKQLSFLNNDKMLFESTDIISNDTIKVIRNEGLPNIETNIKGNIIILFKIKFPESLNIEENKHEQTKTDFAKIFGEEDSLDEDNKNKKLLANNKYRQVYIDSHHKENVANSTEDEGVQQCVQQ